MSDTREGTQSTPRTPECSEPVWRYAEDEDGAPMRYCICSECEPLTPRTPGLEEREQIVEEVAAAMAYCTPAQWVDRKRAEEAANRILALLGAAPPEEPMRAILVTCREALESLPQDALGEGSCAVTHPDGEAGEMRWPIRDELINDINRALNPEGAGR